MSNAPTNGFAIGSFSFRWARVGNSRRNEHALGYQDLADKGRRLRFVSTLQRRAGIRANSVGAVSAVPARGSHRRRDGIRRLEAGSAVAVRAGRPAAGHRRLPRMPRPGARQRRTLPQLRQSHLDVCVAESRVGSPLRFPRMGAAQATFSAEKSCSGSAASSHSATRKPPPVVTMPADSSAFTKSATCILNVVGVALEGVVDERALDVGEQPRRARRFAIAQASGLGSGDRGRRPPRGPAELSCDGPPIGRRSVNTGDGVPRTFANGSTRVVGQLCQRSDRSPPRVDAPVSSGRPRHGLTCCPPASANTRARDRASWAASGVRTAAFHRRRTIARRRSCRSSIRLSPPAASASAAPVGRPPTARNGAGSPQNPRCRPPQTGRGGQGRIGAATADASAGVRHGIEQPKNAAKASVGGDPQELDMVSPGTKWCGPKNRDARGASCCQSCRSAMGIGFCERALQFAVFAQT